MILVEKTCPDRSECEFCPGNALRTFRMRPLSTKRVQNENETSVKKPSEHDPLPRKRHLRVQNGTSVEETRRPRCPEQDLCPGTITMCSLVKDSSPERSKCDPCQSNDCSITPLFHYSIVPTFYYSIISLFHYSIILLFQCCITPLCHCFIFLVSALFSLTCLFRFSHGKLLPFMSIVCRLLVSVCLFQFVLFGLR